MALHYLIWKGTNSRTKYIRVRNRMPIIQPQERVNHITIPGREGELTQVEGLLIKTFLEHKGETRSRDDLLERVWGRGYSDDFKVVDVNVRRLRLKIEKDPTAPEHIVTVWGSGYKWKE